MQNLLAWPAGDSDQGHRLVMDAAHMGYPANGPGAAPFGLDLL